MVLRRVAALIVLGIGAWLLYGGLNAMFTIMGRGSDLANAIFDPPTTFIRLLAASLMVIGGLMAGLQLKTGGIIGLIGSAILGLLGTLLLLSTSNYLDGIDEALYATAGVALSILILTLKRN